METQDKQLIKKIIVKGRIAAVNGLHIGGSNMNLQIGGVDTEIVKTAIEGEPYIPGSSLKGKIRSLLEMSLGEIGPSQGRMIQNGPSKNGKVARLFGQTEDRQSKKEAQNMPNVPSRLIFRDCFIVNPEIFEEARNLDLQYTEVKTEIVLDRITASATPRQIERVPARVQFGFEVVLNVFQGNKEFEELPEEEAVKMLFAGMQLLQEDYLGGSGSRGSGQIRFHIESVLERDVKTYYLENNPVDTPYTKVKLPDSLEPIKEEE